MEKMEITVWDGEKLVSLPLQKEIKNGDIVLFRGHDLFSRIIRRVTRSHYSHAGMVARWGEYWMVLEAKRAGVVASRLFHVTMKYHGSMDFFTAKEDLKPPLNREEAVHQAKKALGENYAVWKLFRILWRLLDRKIRNLCRLLRREKKSMLQTRSPATESRAEEYVCSEYVSRCWHWGGVTLTNVPDDLATPEEIAESPALQKIGYLVVPGRGKKAILWAARKISSIMVCGAKRAGRAKLPATSDTPQSDDSARGLRP